MKTLILVTFTGERRLSSDLCQCVSCDYVTALKDKSLIVDILNSAQLRQKMETLGDKS